MQQGTISKVSARQGFAFIKGDDGTRYHFYFSHMFPRMPVHKGDRVEFEKYADSTLERAATARRVRVIARKEDAA